MTELSIVVFAYNEEENVAFVLGELLGWLKGARVDAEVVFVDDGSTDATAARAEAALAGARALVLRHDRNRGIGAALKTGTAAASGERVTFLPADGQIAPAAIGTLLAAAGPDVDLVLSVYDRRDDGLYRKALSFGVRALILGVHGVWLRSDGPYLFRRTLLDPAQLRSDSFFLNFELPIRALRAGLSARTVTIACRPRRAGQSKVAHARSIARVARELVALRFRSG